MPNNLFITYELDDWDANFEKVATEIEKIGTFAQVLPTVWYVKTDQTSEQICQQIWKVMNQEKDALTVIDTTNNTANWQNISQEVAEFFEEEWASS